MHCSTRHLTSLLKSVQLALHPRLEPKSLQGPQGPGALGSWDCSKLVPPQVLSRHSSLAADPHRGHTPESQRVYTCPSHHPDLLLQIIPSKGCSISFKFCSNSLFMVNSSLGKEKSLRKPAAPFSTPCPTSHFHLLQHTRSSSWVTLRSAVPIPHPLRKSELLDDGEFIYHFRAWKRVMDMLINLIITC